MEPTTKDNDAISFIVKFITSIFLFVVALILLVLWLIFGSIILFTVLIRLISLYTIAHLNAFISGTNLAQDFTSAIEERIDKYVSRYVRIIELPKRPWYPLQPDPESDVHNIFKTEMDSLKKNWAISIFVMISYIFSVGLSTGYFFFKSSGGLNFIQIPKQNAKLMVTVDSLKQRLFKSEKDKIEIICELHKDHLIPISTISNVYDIPVDSVELIVDSNK